MAINFPNLPRFTPEEAGAMPDLQQAIMQGLGNYMQLQTQPKQMAQDFLAKQLANKMAGVQAQYAEPMAKTSYDQALFNLSRGRQLLPLEMQAKQAQLELLPFEKQLKQAQMQAAIAKAQKDAGIVTGAPEGNIPISSGTRKEHEAQISSIDAVREGIQDLASMVKKQGTPGYLERGSDRRAAYDAQVGLITDLLSKSLKLPAFERAFKGAEVNLTRGFNESDENYLNRIIGLSNKLFNERDYLMNQIKYGIPAKGKDKLSVEKLSTPEETSQKNAKQLNDAQLIALKKYRMQQGAK